MEDSLIRRATIDLNQAGEYLNDYKYKFACENIEAVIDTLSVLVSKLKDKTNK